jgi:hypothetical protein
MTPENFERLHNSVERIEKAIIGDEEMGHRGLASRVEWIERKLATHEKQIWKWIGAIGAIGVLLPIITKHLLK